MSRATVEARHRPLSPHARLADGWGPRVVLLVSLLLTFAPFLAVGIHATARLGTTFRDLGDQAVFGIDVHDASTLHQLLGPYSRFAWSHPGPSWFYLLAPLYRALGGNDAALIGANVLLNGLFAVAVVAAVHRSTRPALTLVTAGLVLAYVLRMPAVFFVQLWNPFALLLATLLFLFLAAHARDGRASTAVLVLMAGSFLVQTHVGTAPLVGVVWVAALVAFWLGRRAARRTAAAALVLDGGAVDTGLPPAASDALPVARERWWRRRGGTAALVVVLAAMWAPPVYQQLTSPLRQGNLTRLAHFFLFQGDQGPQPTIHQSVIAVGRLLAMVPYGWDPGPYQMDVSSLPMSVAVGLLAQLVVSAFLIVAGRRLGSGAALWTGVATALALLTAIVSVHTVTGTLYWYLALWVTVIPIATLVGLAQLAFDLAARTPAGNRRAAVSRLATSRGAALGLSAVLAAGATATGLSLAGAVSQVPSSAGVAAVDHLVQRQLSGRRLTDVKVDLVTHDLWPVASGLVQELLQDGADVHVSAQNADLFGTRATRADSRVELTLVAPTDTALPRLLHAGNQVLGTVDTEVGPAEVLIRGAS